MRWFYASLASSVAIVLLAAAALLFVPALPNSFRACLIGFSLFAIAKPLYVYWRIRRAAPPSQRKPS
jgi:hypothetical protein